MKSMILNVIIAFSFAVLSLMLGIRFFIGVIFGIVSLSVLMFTQGETIPMMYRIQRSMERKK